MYKHKLSKKQDQNIERKAKKKKKQRERVRPNTLNQSFPSLILTIPLNQVYSQTNNKVISNIKLEGLGPGNVPIK